MQVFSGTAQLQGSGKVLVSGGKKELQLYAKEIILATGSAPVELKHIPYDGRIIVNSDQAIAFDEVPPETCRYWWWSHWT